LSLDPAAVHPWPRDFANARAVQEDLCKRVRIQKLRRRVRIVAGCDVSIEKDGKRVFGAIILMSWPGLERLETSTAVGEASFPYVPGYLSFREGPLLDQAFRGLRDRPDLVIFDGQGFAHPRRFGLACHLGVLWDVPSIGCAKTRLIGEADTPGSRKGDWTPLLHKGEVIGSVVRTREGTKPVYVSPGHRIDHEGAREAVLMATSRFRLPEPTRRAHGEVNALRRAWLARNVPGSRQKNVK